MIVKTDAIVLKSMRYRETSKIVTFYSRRYGKLAAIAKGAREIKSKFGASLEPMTAVSLVIYKKEHRDLQLISQCDILKPYKKIHGEMGRMSAAMAMLELVNQLTHDEEEKPALYVLLEESLDGLESAAKNFQNLFFAFEFRLCGVFGFAPALGPCLRCGRDVFSGPENVVTFQLDKGGLLCASCTAAMKLRTNGAVATGPFVHKGNDTHGRPPVFVTLHSITARIMQKLFDAKLDTVAVLEYAEKVGNELDETLRSYLRYHFEDLKPLRSTAVFEKIVN